MLPWIPHADRSTSQYEMKTLVSLRFLSGSHVCVCKSQTQPVSTRSLTSPQHAAKKSKWSLFQDWHLENDGVLRGGGLQCLVHATLHGWMFVQRLRATRPWGDGKYFSLTASLKVQYWIFTLRSGLLVLGGETHLKGVLVFAAAATANSNSFNFQFCHFGGKKHCRYELNNCCCFFYRKIIFVFISNACNGALQNKPSTSNMSHLITWRTQPHSGENV